MSCSSLQEADLSSTTFMYQVYVLKSKLNGEIYIGSTNNLKRRIEEHNSGKSPSTSRYIPWSLIYCESFLEESLARSREHNLKHNGNALRELKKRIGFVSSREQKIAGALSSTTFTQRKSGAGFTLIEVIISVGIVGILASGITLGLSNFLNSRTLNDAVNGITAALRNAEVRAASGENNSSWGVHFVNNAVNPDYYQLFYGPSFAAGTIVSKTYLPSRIQMSDPASGASVDIIFTQTTGVPNAAASITIQLISNLSSGQTVSVNSLGGIAVASAVVASGPAPTVTSASPSSRGSGAVSQSLAITGTGFSSGASASFSGSGFTINSTTFNSSTQVTADVTIAESATTGARNVIVTNSDAQFGTCTGCFTVNTGPTTISANPATLSQGASAQNVVITGTGYASGASASFSGDGITVNQTTFQSATQVTANVSITAGASATARNITVTNSTDAGAGTGTGIFTVTAGVTYETAGGGANASGGGSCVAAAAWTDTEACVMVPAGTPTGSQPSKLRSNSLDSNTSSFTGQ